MSDGKDGADDVVRAHGRSRSVHLESSANAVPTIEDRHSTKLISSHSPRINSPPSVFSEWSHQHSTEAPVVVDEVIRDANAVINLDDDEDWQEMPAIAEHDIYDDYSGRIVAHADPLTQDNLAGKAKGYSRVQGDDDARSVDSVDEQTNHLFNAAGDNSGLDDEATIMSQLSHTKDLLTEGQRIAYIGICKLVLVAMLKDATVFNSSKHSKGESRYALEGMILWSQKTTVRLYQHIEITPAEQLMMEQLSEHHIEARDLAPALMTATRVSNPMHESNSPSSPPTYTDATSNDHTQNSGKENDKSGVTHVDKEIIDSVTTSAEAPSATTDSRALQNQEKIDLDIRWTVLFDLFLLLLSDSHYDARSRVLLIQVAKVLDVSYLELTKFEKKVTDALEVQDQENAHVSQDEEKSLTTNRDKTSRNRRYMMMGLATIGGGLVIGLSAGLLAPVIGAGLGAGFASIGVSGATSFLAGTTGAALITTSGVVTGSTIATRSAAKRVSSVKTFEFKPLYDNKRVNLLITVPGWLAGSEDDVRLPFSTIDPVMGDICSVLWEPELLRTFQATGNILATEVLTQSLQQVLGQTVLTALMSALQWPLVLTKLSYLIDNPWSNSLDRAKAAGLILADALISRSLGVRPVSLVGYSLGARVIYFALLELAKEKAYGIVENVYIFGAPVVVTSREWRKAKSVVAGRFVNGYVQNDWILGYLFRATSGGIGRVAGLRPVEGIEFVENIDCTSDVAGHMGYRQAIPRLMKKVGYETTSEEFQEIDDPDPDKTRERAKELLDNIEEARKHEGVKKKKKSFFSFGRSKNLVTPDALPTQCKEETVQYDAPVRMQRSVSATGHPNTKEPMHAASIDDKFDIAKIRTEASKIMPTSRSSRPTVPRYPSDSTRTQSLENISMSFDISASPSRAPSSEFDESRASTPVPNVASLALSTKDQEPSGYVPRPSLQHANTATGTFAHVAAPQPRNSGSSFLTTASVGSRASTTAERIMGPSRSPTPNGIAVSQTAPAVQQQHHEGYGDEEDFSAEGEVTMSFG